MKKKYKFVVIAMLVLTFLVVAVLYLRTTNIAVLNPKGPIALKERNLIILTALMSLVVIIPVFTMLFVFAWRYRDTNTNTKASYAPDWDHSRLYESIWWLVPSALIAVLAVVAWNSSYQLNPYKPLVSTKKPIFIQVVALDWKWLFIYPQQGIASVNFFQFPKQTPVSFELTADAPMNSFWIPQLSGQIYAMPGMSTKLNLAASEDGNFNGASANISGEGFAGMTFVARASSQANFNAWVTKVRNSPNSLTLNSYNKLAEPSKYNPVSYYSAADDAGLYDTIIDKYMVPNGGASTQIKAMPDMSASEMANMPGMEWDYDEPVFRQLAWQTEPKRISN